MRYAKDHKAAMRSRIVDVAGRTFRRQGIAASGVAELMSEAGLTPGGLYAHFASKDALVAEVLSDIIGQTEASMRANISAARDADEPLLGRVIDAYLSEFHFDSLDISCANASLGSEIGHQADVVREVANRKFEDTVAVIAAALPDESRFKAAPLFAMLAGSLQFAWLGRTHDEQHARLADGKRAARAFIGID